MLSFGVRLYGKMAQGVVSLQLSVVSFWRLDIDGLFVIGDWFPGKDGLLGWLSDGVGCFLERCVVIEFVYVG